MKTEAFPDDPRERLPRLPGRNEPCLCGSGRKYKICCVPLQQERMRWDPLEDRVRTLVAEFVSDERFDEDLERASSVFGFDRDTGDLPDERLFYDWYIHDYIVPRKGKALIMLLEEERMARGADDEETKKTIGSWASSTFSFLEVLEVKRGAGFRARDILCDSEYFVWDVSGSYSLSKYDVLFSRPYRVGRIVRIASGALAIPQRMKSRVQEYVKASYQDFARNGGGTIDDYLRSQSLSITKYLRTLSATRSIFLTSEGDILLFSSCEYTLSDLESAVRLLDTCEEFVDVGEEASALRYDWVSKVGEQEQDGRDETRPSLDGAFRVHTYLLDLGGKNQRVVLGNISLMGKKLEVSCTSDRRLQSCKALIEKLLGRLIVGRTEDRYLEPDSVPEAGGEKEEYREDEEDFPPQVQRKIAEKFFDEYYAKWLRMKVPALGNMTPMNASKTSEGRRKLEEMLRMAENEAERGDDMLKPPLAKLRAALGL